MPRRSKLTDEERIAAVQEYLEGKGRYAAILQHWSVSNQTEQHDTDGVSPGVCCVTGRRGISLSSFVATLFTTKVECQLLLTNSSLHILHRLLLVTT